MTIADLQTLTRFLTSTNTTTLTAANLLILNNKWYEEVIGNIIGATVGSKRPFGDFNWTGFPTEEITLTNSTADYALSGWGTTDAEAPIAILGAEVLDEDGNWHLLRRTSLKEIQAKGSSQSEYQETDGRPSEYEIRDNVLVLYPAPDNGVSVTLVGGLRLHYLRTADRYTAAEVTTGTKEPGFPSPWHDLLAYGSAYDYGLATGLPTTNGFKQIYDTKMKDLLEFIVNRDQDVDESLTPATRLYK